MYKEHYLKQGFKSIGLLSDNSELFIKDDFINNQELCWYIRLKSGVPTSPHPELLSKEIIKRLYNNI